MATLTKTGGTGTIGHVSGNGVSKAYVQSSVIDGTSTALTNGDVYQAINIPANTVLLGAGIDKVTAGTGTGTLALGDGTITFVAAAAVSAVGAMAGLDNVNETFVQYPVTNTLDVTVGTADVNAKVRVWAVLANTEGSVGDDAVGDTYA